MELKIKTSPSKYFNQLLTILQFLPPFDIVSPKERELLSEILTYNWAYKTIPTDDRWTLITSPDIREKMRLKLAISKAGLNNLYVSLRKKGVITYSGVSEQYVLTPFSTLTIKFHSDAD